MGVYFSREGPIEVLVGISVACSNRVFEIQYVRRRAHLRLHQQAGHALRLTHRARRTRRVRILLLQGLASRVSAVGKFVCGTGLSSASPGFE